MAVHSGCRRDHRADAIPPRRGSSEGPVHVREEENRNRVCIHLSLPVSVKIPPEYYHSNT